MAQSFFYKYDSLLFLFLLVLLKSLFCRLNCLSCLFVLCLGLLFSLLSLL
tara:strand:- start:179 stop:328 length:150 start_codon:yes stop_codon:yes gene_type:complete